MSQSIDYRGITAAFSKCGLAVGTTSTITAATATTYAIQGKTYTKRLVATRLTQPLTQPLVPHLLLCNQGMAALWCMGLMLMAIWLLFKVNRRH